MGEQIFEQLVLLTDRFWENTGNWLGEHGFEIAIILFMAWLAKRYGAILLTRILHSTIRSDLYPTKSDRIKRLETIDSLTNALVKALVFVIAAIMIVSELGVNTTPIIASAGVIGIALGFGAQSLIKDLTSGMFIIIDNRYRVGDVVQLGDISGKVEAITIRTTVLRDLEGIQYHIPNGSITSTANMTMSYGGIDENITFDHSVDIGKLTLLIDRVGADMEKDPELEKKIKVPPRFERIVGFDTNGVKVKITGTTTTNDSWEIKGEFYKRLLKELQKSGIAIPKQQVTIHQADTSKSRKTVNKSKS